MKEEGQSLQLYNTQKYLRSDHALINLSHLSYFLLWLYFYSNLFTPMVFFFKIFVFI